MSNKLMVSLLGGLAVIMVALFIMSAMGNDPAAVSSEVASKVQYPYVQVDTTPPANTKTQQRVMLPDVSVQKVTIK